MSFRVIAMFVPIAAVCTGCSQAPVPGQTVVPAPVPRPLNWLEPLSVVEGDRPVLPDSVEKFEFVVQSAVIPEHHMGFLGLTNLTVISNHTENVFARSEVAGLTRMFTNVTVRTNKLAARIGLGKPEGLSNFLAAASQMAGVEIGNASKVALNKGGEAFISLSAGFTIVADEIHTSTVPGGSHPLTTNVAVSTSLFIKPLEMGSNYSTFSFAGLLDDFKGYAGNGNGGTKPNPIFEVNGWSAEAPVSRGQVTVVASGPYENVFRYQSSVPYLGSIVIIGKYFRESGTQTNRFYRVYFIETEN